MKKQFLHISFVLFIICLFVSIISCANDTVDNNLYTISYITELGEAPKSIMREKNSVLAETDLPVLTTTEDYSFVGWFIGNNQITAGTKVTENMILLGKWKSNSYFVTFDSQGGNSVNGQIIKKDGIVSVPNNPEKTGYVFYGWYTDSDCNEKYNFELPVTSSFTLYARWVRNFYTISFNTNTSTTLDDISVAENDLIPEIQDLTKEGYVFAGWFTDIDLTLEYDIKTPVTANLILYAKWTIDKTVITTAVENLYEVFNSLDKKYEPYTIIITDKKPDLSIVKKAINANKILINLNLTNCTELTSLLINDEAVFKGNEYLYSISLPDSITVLPLNAFCKCKNLKYASINSVSRIEANAFYDCQVLEKCDLPDTLEYIGDWAFRECYAISSITIPQNVTFLGNSAFYHCTNLSTITILSANIEFDYYTFQSTAITLFVIPKGTKTLKGHLFSFCDKLSEIYIPSSITSIENEVFRGCKSLKKVYYQGSKYDWADISIGTDNTELSNASFIYNTDY